MTQPANESNAKRPGEFIPHRGEINGEEAPNPVFRSSRSGSNDRPKGIDDYLIDLRPASTMLEVETAFAAAASIVPDDALITVHMRSGHATGIAAKLAGRQTSVVIDTYRRGEPDWDRLALDERIDRGPGRPIQVHDFVAPLPPDAEPWPWYGTNDTEDLLPTVSPDRPTIALAYALAGIMVFLAGCASVYFISP